MTPAARATLHAYCETTRRERVAREGMAPQDRIADLHVFWVCMACIVAIVCIEFGRKMERDGWRSCPQRLEDGRFLMAEKWGVRGAERCTYETPRPAKVRRG